jgi:hypothetical protein
MIVVLYLVFIQRGGCCRSLLVQSEKQAEKTPVSGCVWAQKGYFYFILFFSFEGEFNASFWMADQIQAVIQYL